MARCAIIGSGLAGCLTAIALHDAGHNVKIYEKMSFPGGISATAGGGLRVSNNKEQTFKYLKQTCAGTTDDDILKLFAEKMQNITPYITKLANEYNASVLVSENDDEKPVQNFGFEGWESLGMAFIEDVPNVNYKELYPHVFRTPTKQHPSTGPAHPNLETEYGLNLYHIAYQHVLKRNIKVNFYSTAQRLIKENGDTITGVVINNKIVPTDYTILACGGFENDPKMKMQYFQGKPSIHNGFEGNTGDGIRMAQQIGSDLWHMWHYHGSYGFEVKPGMGARIKGANIWSPTFGDADSIRPLRHIVVDANGRRFMNEDPPYITDIGHRPLELFNTEEVRYNRIPAYFISDETGRQIGPWGSLRSNGIPIEPWSNDNAKEIESGIFTKCNNTKELADYINCNEAILKDTPPPIKYCNETILKNTISEWNLIASGQKICPWHRPAKKNEQLLDKPYYIGKVWPVIGNTQGGPRTDKNRQVVDPFDNAIKGLYTAGECGSIFGHLYMSAGNFTECFVSAELISDHIKIIDK